MDNPIYFLGEVTFLLLIGQNGHRRVLLKIKKVKYLGLQLHEIKIYFSVLLLFSQCSAYLTCIRRLLVIHCLALIQIQFTSTYIAI